jgi:hypothetical protein
MSGIKQSLTEKQHNVLRRHATTVRDDIPRADEYIVLFRSTAAPETKRERVKQHLLTSPTDDRPDVHLAFDLGVSPDTVRRARQELHEDSLPRAILSRTAAIQLRNADLMTQVRKHKSPNDLNRRRWVWTTPTAIHDRAVDLARAQSSPCGCGHSGIRNLGDGEFTCTTDSCDIRVPREEVDL